MQGTIGVWSPTLQEVKFQSLPDSLLVSLHDIIKPTTFFCTVTIMYCFSIPAAEFADLVSELDDVNDWVPFGLLLGIKMPKLEAIRRDYQTIGERRTQMLYQWQKNVIPTWSAVVQALSGIGMRSLASELAQKHG